MYGAGVAQQSCGTGKLGRRIRGIRNNERDLHGSTATTGKIEKAFVSLRVEVDSFISETIGLTLQLCKGSGNRY